jgi:hypothetical protein
MQASILACMSGDVFSVKVFSFPIYVCLTLFYTNKEGQ